MNEGTRAGGRARRELRRGLRKEKRPRTRLETDERRAHLLELSMQAFSERAYDDVSIDDIARAAGISKGLLYHYFPTKREFYVAGLNEAARQLLEKTLATPEGATPLDRLRHALDAYLEYVSRHARGYRALLRGGIGSDPEVAKVVEGVRAKYLEHLVSGGADGPIDVSLRERPIVKMTLHGWIGFVEAATLAWAETRDVPLTRVRDLLVDVLISSAKLAIDQPLTKDW
jgi:AcrR family transcriptional regulator